MTVAGLLCLGVVVALCAPPPAQSRAAACVQRALVSLQMPRAIADRLYNARARRLRTQQLADERLFLQRTAPMPWCYVVTGATQAPVNAADYGCGGTYAGHHYYYSPTTKCYLWWCPRGSWEIAPTLGYGLPLYCNTSGARGQDPPISQDQKWIFTAPDRASPACVSRVSTR